MRIYFGHPVTTYGSGVEADAISAIEEHFADGVVVNPNGKDHQAAYAIEGMGYFERLAESCEVGAFLSFSDGAWGAGVLREARAMKASGKRIYQVAYWSGSAAWSTCWKVWTWDPSAGMVDHPLTVDQTRARIAAGLR